MHFRSLIRTCCNFVCTRFLFCSMFKVISWINGKGWAILIVSSNHVNKGKRLSNAHYFSPIFLTGFSRFNLATILFDFAFTYLLFYLIIWKTAHESASIHASSLLGWWWWRILHENERKKPSFCNNIDWVPFCVESELHLFPIKG